jgi:hypothetical protein
MAIPWLAALKVIPWGDVMEHAPKVLNKARDLIDRRGGPSVAPAAAAEAPAADAAAAPGMDELITRLHAAHKRIDQLAQEQQDLRKTVAELAQDHARLDAALSRLRLRTRRMRWLLALLGLAIGAGVAAWALVFR